MSNISSISNKTNITNTPVVQNLIINLIGSNQFTTLLPIFKLINNNDGNIVATQFSQLGNHFSGYFQVDGHWDKILKIESALKTLANKLDVQIIFQRTMTDDIDQKDYIPYKISVNNLDEPGLLEKIYSFFVLQEIIIQNLSSTSYSSEYESELAEIDIKIKIPSDVHIPSLKEEFNTLCYNENLDASLSPCKKN